MEIRCFIKYIMLEKTLLLCRHDAAVDDMHHELGAVSTVSLNLTVFVFKVRFYFTSKLHFVLEI